MTKVAVRQHYVPDGWDALNQGVCPHCGEPVRWDARKSAWVADRKLRVLVLTRDQATAVRNTVSGLTGIAVENQLDMQDMQQQIAEQDRARYEGDPCGHFRHHDDRLCRAGNCNDPDGHADYETCDGCESRVCFGMECDQGFGWRGDWLFCLACLARTTEEAKG